MNDGAKRGIQSIGNGLGVVTGDIDLDGDIDIYVANDITQNLLYLNQGDGTFEECGTELGVDMGDKPQPDGSMGVGFVDFNMDGLPDIGVGNYEAENFALYKQVRIGGTGSDSFLFSLASKKAKLTAIDQLYVNWGTIFEDLDCDGDDDLVITNGHPMYFPAKGTMAQKPLIFSNEKGSFRHKNVVKSDYFLKTHFGRGLMAADFDSDGDLDLAFSHCDEQFAMLENKTKRENKLTRVQIIGTQGNRDGINAVLRTPNGVKLRAGGGSYLSSADQACWLLIEGDNAPKIDNFGELELTQIENRIYAIEIPRNQ